jgi:hypothetical protein
MGRNGQGNLPHLSVHYWRFAFAFVRSSATQYAVSRTALLNSVRE